MKKDVILTYLGNECLTEAVLDSGADITVISAELAEELNLEYNGNATQLQAANGENFWAVETFPIHIKLDGTNFSTSIPVHVSTETECDILLGEDYLSEAGVEMNYGNNSIVLYSNRVLKEVRCLPRPVKNIGLTAILGGVVGGIIEGPKGVLKGALIGAGVGLTVSVVESLIEGLNETYPNSY